MALTKDVIYYTDNRLDPLIAKACQAKIEDCCMGKYRLIGVSLKPMEFGRYNFAKNIVMDLERGPLTMFKQILAGLEASNADVIFFAEHDCLYHPTHFDFVPETKHRFYYNTNVWKVDSSSGHALFCNDTRQTSGLCAYRELLLAHYRERVRRVEAEGYSTAIGYEPGTHNRPERIDDYKSESWMSLMPNIDIRHEYNLTPSRWRKDQFRNQRYTNGWKEADCVEGWYEQGQFSKLLEEVSNGR